ncbi:MAG: bifunctional chorismate mutase/prephenate dehydratase [Lachnospiraceae bacterium]
MTDLLVLRDEIDKIDKEIVELFEKRMEISKGVAEYKISTGKKVFDKEREEGKLRTLSGLAHSQFNAHGVTELFQQIMAMSRKLQYQLMEKMGVEDAPDFEMLDCLNTDNIRVVYQGLEGAYAHQATLEYFGEDVNCYHVERWRDAMEALKDGSADYAVLPLENSTAGIVGDNYDLLEEYDNCIVGEKIITIDHALMGLPGAELSDIKYVYSHPQALMQCSRYLDEHREWEQVSLSNTAVAASYIKESRDVTKAAIGSVQAAGVYGLKVLKEHIHHVRKNSTRFIIVTNRKVFVREAEKISICFDIPHQSGSLYNIMSHLIYNDLNMTKIESRPIVGKQWEYHFFVDIDGNLNDSAVKNALRGIGEETANFKILGNY